MNVEILKSNKMLIESLKNNLSLSDDADLESKLSGMSSHEVFERFLNWNNIIGYATKLWNTYEILSNSLVNDKLNFDKLSEEDQFGDILEDLRLRGEFPDSLYEDFNEKPFIKHIESMSLEKAFGEYLAWNGIMGFDTQISRAIESIKKANI